jgi:hypothetical protein
MPMDTLNKFAVGAIGDQLMVLALSPKRLTKDDALNLAAWLFTMADLEDTRADEFAELVKAIRES